MDNLELYSRIYLESVSSSTEIKEVAPEEIEKELMPLSGKFEADQILKLLKSDYDREDSLFYAVYSSSDKKTKKLKRSDGYKEEHVFRQEHCLLEADFCI